MKQLEYSINAVFDSWQSERAVKYRILNKITGLIGTAVNVQTMVFGNMGDDCATGVAFTRDGSTGEAKPMGEYLINAQGEDVVAGIRTPKNLDDLVNETRARVWSRPANNFSKPWRCSRSTTSIRRTSSLRFSRASCTCCRPVMPNESESPAFAGRSRWPPARTSSPARNNPSCSTPKTALQTVTGSDLEQLAVSDFRCRRRSQENSDLHRTSRRPRCRSRRNRFGFAQSRRDQEEAIPKKKLILVRHETSPEDVGGMGAAEGILTSTGGMTSHAAVVARGWGKCCICGAGDLKIDYKRNALPLAKRRYKEGDVLSLNGSTGKVYEGEIPTESSPVVAALVEGKQNGAETLDLQNVPDRFPIGRTSIARSTSEPMPIPPTIRQLRSHLVPKASDFAERNTCFLKVIELPTCVVSFWPTMRQDRNKAITQSASAPTKGL